MERKLNLVNILLVLTILVVKSEQVRVDQSCSCGRANTAGRIVNGNLSTPHKYPWMAAMYVPSVGGDYFHCGGSVISNRNILTAGHCIFYLTAGEVLMSYWRLGMHYQLDGERFDTQASRLHPKFDNLTTHDTFDMAMVVVNREIQFNRYVVPICLPTPNQNFDNQMATVAGWGRIKEDIIGISDILRETKIRVMPESECMNQPLFDYIEFDAESMVCAFAPKTDSCQGDSGGPLFFETRPNQHDVLGVVSFGVGCARGTGIYGKITSPGTLVWIYNLISKSGASICTKNK